MRLYFEFYKVKEGHGLCDEFGQVHIHNSMGDKLCTVNFDEMSENDFESLSMVFKRYCDCDVEFKSMEW